MYIFFRCVILKLNNLSTLKTFREQLISFFSKMFDVCSLYNSELLLFRWPLKSILLDFWQKTLQMNFFWCFLTKKNLVPMIRQLFLNWRNFKQTTSPPHIWRVLVNVAVMTDFSRFSQIVVISDYLFAKLHLIQS